MRICKITITAAQGVISGRDCGKWEMSSWSQIMESQTSQVSARAVNIAALSGYSETAVYTLRSLYE